MYDWRYVCVCMCMSVLCLRGGCIFCVTFPALAFSYLLWYIRREITAPNLIKASLWFCPLLTENVFVVIQLVQADHHLAWTSVWIKSIKYTYYLINNYKDTINTLESLKELFPFDYIRLWYLYNLIFTFIKCNNAYPRVVQNANNCSSVSHNYYRFWTIVYEAVIYKSCIPKYRKEQGTRRVILGSCEVSKLNFNKNHTSCYICYLWLTKAFKCV